MDRPATDGDPAMRVYSADVMALRLQESRDLARAKVASRMSARAEAIARTPPGRYNGYASAGSRFSQADPPDPPTSTPTNAPVEFSPFDSECVSDDALLAAMADCAGSQTDGSDVIPDLVECEAAPPLVASVISGLARVSTDATSASFPDSPAPPIPPSLTIGTPDCCNDELPVPHMPTFTGSNGTNDISSGDFAADYRNTLQAIYRLNALTNFLVGGHDRVALAGGGYVVRQDVVDACKTLRVMLEAMFDRLQIVD